MSITYSITDTSNNYIEVGLGELDPLQNFPDIYGNIDFAFTVILSHSEGSITSISANAVTDDTIVSVLSENSFRVERNPSANTFPGEFFEYVSFSDDFTQKTFQVLSPGDVDEADEDSSVIEWKLPETLTKTTSYDIIVTYQDMSMQTQVETISYDQVLYWYWVNGIQTLIEQVEKSRY
jgi:hypothetical protein